MPAANPLCEATAAAAKEKDMSLRKFLPSIAYRLVRVVVALLHRLILHLNKKKRAEWVAWLVSIAYEADEESAFGSSDHALSQRELSLPIRERLLARACSGFDPVTIPDSLVGAFVTSVGGSLHFSQEGEDIFVNRLFGDRQSGYYIDVGAHHPTRFSNTFALYKKGWRGINIDATPGSMDPFKKLRPDDINLEVAVSDKTEPLALHVFKEGALNTFDPLLSMSYTTDGWEKVDMIELQPRPLADVLDQYVPVGQTIDLLSIDVEGEDLGVLRSNDWGKYCPDVIIIEALGTPFLSLGSHPAIIFLASRGFVPVSRLYNSVILRRLENLPEVC